eukprot:Gb_28870 [translate_table: standard]
MSITMTMSIHADKEHRISPCLLPSSMMYEHACKSLVVLSWGPIWHAHVGEFDGLHRATCCDQAWEFGGMCEKQLTSIFQRSGKNNIFKGEIRIGGCCPWEKASEDVRDVAISKKKVVLMMPRGLMQGVPEDHAQVGNIQLERMFEYFSESYPYFHSNQVESWVCGAEWSL